MHMLRVMRKDKGADKWTVDGQAEVEGGWRRKRERERWGRERPMQLAANRGEGQTAQMNI